MVTDMKVTIEGKVASVQPYEVYQAAMDLLLVERDRLLEVAGDLFIKEGSVRYTVGSPKQGLIPSS